jgi:hypothetical protein
LVWPSTAASALFSVVDVGFDLDAIEWPDRGRSQDGAVGTEPRTVTRTVPAGLRGVTGHGAPQMGAGGRDGLDGAVRPAMGADDAPVDLDQTTVARLEVTEVGRSTR